MACTYWVHFIFGLPSDRPQTFSATAAIADRAELTFAQFVMLTPFPGTVDFHRWEKNFGPGAGLSPKDYAPSCTGRTPSCPRRKFAAKRKRCGIAFYAWHSIWRRSRFLRSNRSRLAFVLISRLYRQMYADTGIATDSARVAWSTRWARWLAPPCRLLFAARPMPDLDVPKKKTTPMAENCCSATFSDSTPA